MLREAALLPASVEHTRALARPHHAEVVVVTTAREDTQASPGKPPDGGTISVARELTARGQCVHLHHPDPAGAKADQLNYAAQRCLANLPDEPAAPAVSWSAATPTPSASSCK